MEANAHAIANLQVAIPTHFRDDVALSPVIDTHQRLVPERFREAHFSRRTGVAERHMLRSHLQGNPCPDGGGRDDWVSELDIELRRLKVIAAISADLTGNDVHRRRPEKAGNKQVGRTPVDLQRRADLLDPSRPYDHDAVTHGHGLGLIMGDVNEGRAQVCVELLEFRAHFDPELGVETGEGLIQKKDVGIGDGGAC